MKRYRYTLNIAAHGSPVIASVYTEKGIIQRLKDFNKAHAKGEMLYDAHRAGLHTGKPCNCPGAYICDNGVPQKIENGKLVPDPA